MPDDIENRIRSLEQRLDVLEKSIVTPDDIARKIAGTLEKAIENIGKTAQES